MACNTRIRKFFHPMVSAFTLLFGFSAAALPFNTDMMSGQLSNGRIIRSKASGSIPMGASKRHVLPENDPGYQTLSNPVSATHLSISRGQRLFDANCTPCHGKYIDGKHTTGTVSKWLPGLDFTLPPLKEKPDGHYFQFIHYGGMGLMPPYGSKFSIEEHWDIVNYIRHIQKTYASSAPQN